MARPIAELKDLTARLRALLSHLENADTSDGASLGRVWADCQAAFRSYRSNAPDLEAVPEEERAEFATLLEDAVRLNAIVASMAARQGEEISRGLEEIVRVRKFVHSAVSNARTGASCDVRG